MYFLIVTAHAVRKPFPLLYDNGQNSHLSWGATRTGSASKNLPSGLASTRAQTPHTHHHHDLPPHAPWLHLHLKLPKAGSASKTWSCIPLAQVPAMSSAPTFSTFKSRFNTIKYTRVDSAFCPTLLAGSLPCTLALSSAQNTPTKVLTMPPGRPWGPSNCLAIYARTPVLGLYSGVQSKRFTPPSHKSSKSPPQHSQICRHFSVSPGS